MSNQTHNGPIDQYPAIPWEDAEALAKKHDQHYIVALLWSAKTNIETVLTWGDTMAQSEGAAKLGNKLKEYLGWAPSQRTAVSGKVQILFDYHEKLLVRTAKLVAEINSSGLANKFSTTLKGVEFSIDASNRLNQELKDSIHSSDDEKREAQYHMAALHIQAARSKAKAMLVALPEQDRFLANDITDLLDKATNILCAAEGVKHD